MTPNRDTTNVEAFQWGQPLLVIEAVFYSHPDIASLDVYLERLYGTGESG